MTRPMARSAAVPVTPTYYAPNALVSTIDHLATGAGVAQLRAGGNAVDAAVAAAAVLAVTSPFACGMGGDLFALIHVPGTSIPFALNSSGRSGSGADAAVLRARGLTSIPLSLDISAVTVPGCVDGWVAMHQRFGRRPLPEVLSYAADFAEQGFPVSALLANTLPELAGARPPGEFVALTGKAGERLRRPGLARNLRAIGRDGRAAHYEGEFGAGLIELGNGLFTAADLATSCADWVTPVHARAWGADLWASPPNSQGYLIPLGAAIADRLPLPADPDDAEWVHLLAEAAVLAAYDRPAVLHENADVSGHFEPAEIARRADLINSDRRTSVGLRQQRGDTTCLCVVDENRMGVTLIQSNAAGFGSKLFEPHTGIELHNRGIGFSLRPDDVGAYGPRRRPPHTLSPALATRPDGSLRAVLGTAGGDAQPHVVLQVAARLLRSEQSPGEAIGAPRFRLGAPGGTGFDTWTSEQGTTVMLEDGVAESWQPGLTARGHPVLVQSVAKTYAGHAHLISVEADGMLAGAAEPRAGASAVTGF